MATKLTQASTQPQPTKRGIAIGVSVCKAPTPKDVRAAATLPIKPIKAEALPARCGCSSKAPVVEQGKVNPRLETKRNILI